MAVVALDVGGFARIGYGAVQTCGGVPSTLVAGCIAVGGKRLV